MIVGNIWVHVTTVLLLLSLSSLRAEEVGVDVPLPLLVTVALPRSKSKAALFTWGSHIDGSTVFSTLQPLTNSNFRLKEFDMAMLMAMRLRTRDAMNGEGLSPSKSNKMRLIGNAAANLA